MGQTVSTDATAKDSLTAVSTSNYGTINDTKDPPPPPQSSIAPPRRATWTTASQLIIADVIGVGIMSMADAFAQLGWLLGLILVHGMLLLNLYCGWLAWEAQTISFPGTLTLAQIGHRAYGTTGQWVTGVVVYSFLFFVLGNYLLTLGLCLQQVFVTVDMPRPLWSLLGALLLLPFCQIRTLNGARLLLIVNITTIILAVFVSVGHMLAVGERHGETSLIATDLTWRSFVSGLSKFAFAYTGVLMYPEIVSEMEEPADFPKALIVQAPFQLISFLSVGCVGYAYLGSRAEGLLINSLPPGSAASTIAAVSLFIHVLITYLIKGTVLTRALHTMIAPNSLNDTGREGTLTWLALTSCLMLCCFGVASAVPFFDELCSLLGSVQTPIFGFVLPVLFCYAGRKAQGVQIAPPTYVLLAAILGLGVAMFTVGATGEVITIIERWRNRSVLYTTNLFY